MPLCVSEERKNGVKVFRREQRRKPEVNRGPHGEARRRNVHRSVANAGRSCPPVRACGSGQEGLQPGFRSRDAQSQSRGGNFQTIVLARQGFDCIAVSSYVRVCVS